MLTDFSVSRSALDWSGQEVGSSRRRSSRLESEVADAAAEQADEAVDRPRFGPTGHGGGALRVLALRRAPHARSLSAVLDGPVALAQAWRSMSSSTSMRDYGVLGAFALALTVALWMATMSSGMTCDYGRAGDPEAFLCEHGVLRWLLSLTFCLAVVVAIAREQSSTVRSVSRWCVVPLVVASLLVLAWGDAHPEADPQLFTRVWFWAAAWALAYSSVLAFRRQRIAQSGRPTSG